MKKRNLIGYLFFRIIMFSLFIAVEVSISTVVVLSPSSIFIALVVLSQLYNCVFGILVIKEILPNGEIREYLSSEWNTDKNILQSTSLIGILSFLIFDCIDRWSLVFQITVTISLSLEFLDRIFFYSTIEDDPLPQPLIRDEENGNIALIENQA